MAVACEWSITRWIANHLIFAPGSWDADLMISSLTLVVVAVAVVVVVVVVVVVLKNCPPPFWNSLSALPLSALGLWLVCATILCHLCTLPLLCAWSAVGLRHYPLCTLPLVCAWSVVGLRHYPVCTLPFVCAWSAVGLRHYPIVHCHWSALDLRLVCGWFAPLPSVYIAIGLRLVCGWSAPLSFGCPWSAPLSFLHPAPLSFVHVAIWLALGLFQPTLLYYFWWLMSNLCLQHLLLFCGCSGWLQNWPLWRKVSESLPSQ